MIMVDVAMTEATVGMAEVPCSFSQGMEDVRVVVTGCGFKPIGRVFKDMVTGEPTHTEVVIEGVRYKLNIGSAIALVLLKNGFTVHMVSKTEDKLEKLKNVFVDLGCDSSRIEYSAVNLLDEGEVGRFVQCLPRDKVMYWAHAVGLSGGSYKVKDDNPYLPLEDIDVNLIEAESGVVLRSTHLLMKEFLPIFKRQRDARIVMISSMSAKRGYSLGGTHCASKGAIDRYANSAMLALVKDNIFVTTIRPGIIDTGMYDAFPVIDAVKHVGKSYGHDYDDDIPLAPPSAVGQIALGVFRSTAHITSINIVAKRQWPNESS